MTEKELMDLITYGEKLTLECKKSEKDLPKSVWETYSSMANTKGGTILLGIDENPDGMECEQRFAIAGVKKADKLLKDFWSVINGEKINVNILFDHDVEVINTSKGDVISIQVPQADYKRRPVYINGNPYKGTFKRNYEGDYHCTESEVNEMIRDAGDMGNDGILIEGCTLEDVDLPTLKSYRIEYELKNPDHVWNRLDNKEFLIQLGGYKIDRKNNREGLTAAGLLMFGTGLAVRDNFDNILMDFRDECNATTDRRWNDRITYDGMWENNLYNFFKRVIPKLVLDIKRPFYMDGISRVDDTLIHKAVREAFVNLIIHSDYMIEGTLKIIKRTNCLEFANPGILKLPVKSIYEGGNSKARNPRIQTMFRMIGLGENIGSGFPMILKAWGEENWRKPDIGENIDLRQVELKLWMISLMPEDCLRSLKELYGASFGKLNHDEQIALATAYLEGDVTNYRLQAIIDMHPTDIGKMLSQLVQENMLIANGRARWTKYYINYDYVIGNCQMTFDDITLDKQKRFKETDGIIYQYIQENGFITTNQVLQITRIKTLQGANVAVKRLEKAKLIRKVRRGRSVYYQLA